MYDELAKNVNAIQNTDTSNLVKEADHNTKIAEIEEKYLIIIMANILLLRNLINKQQIILLQDWQKQI